MTIGIHEADAASLSGGRGVMHSGVATLRIVAIAAGLAWSIAFIVLGLHDGLQMYGDGSIFSYAVAVQDSWAFHFHNISGRSFVWLYAMLPAELLVAVTHDPMEGVALYGFLFFSAQLLGLAATWMADRSRGRIIFSFACGSTALICPMVFGAPTETWISHALFWPALAFAHGAPRSRAAALAIFALLLALILTHAGAVMFAFTIVGTLWLRGAHDAGFRRAAVALFVALALWTAVKLTWLPDDYIATVLANAALHAFDPAASSNLINTIAAAILGFVVALLILRKLKVGPATTVATLLVTATLGIYWLWFDTGLHTYDRYYLRTIVLVATPALGILAAADALAADGRLTRRIPPCQRS